MKILPTPTPDEIAAILIAMQTAAPQHADVETKPQPSRWRMAGRDYASGSPRDAIRGALR